MRARPAVVVFDVVETLMSLAPLGDWLAVEGVPGELLPRWFDRIVRDGVALTLAGDYWPFPEVAESALRSVAPRLSGAGVRRVLDGFADLPAHPDAEPAMRALTEAGVSVVCLSNGPALSTANFLWRSGLAGHVGDVLSAEDVGRWKPAREVYRHALRHVGRPPSEVAMVAVHAWDCHGAHRAGLTTGWASRLEGRFPEVFHPPDVSGHDLVDVVLGLLAMPRALTPE